MNTADIKPHLSLTQTAGKMSVHELVIITYDSYRNSVSPSVTIRYRFKHGINTESLISPMTADSL